MGANATTFVPSYTSGEVLTAADLTVTNSGIPVFADSTARDNGFGGTGEKILAEGQYAYLESTNATQVYDGAAWQPVGVSPGLVLVKSQTIGTTVSSVAVTDAFSASYDNYFITINDGISSANGVFTFIFTGSTASYYATRVGLIYSGASSSFGSDNNASSLTAVGVSQTSGLYAAINVSNPFLAKPAYGTFSYQGIANDTGVLGFWNHRVSTSYTGFTIAPSAGTITGGTIRVYGYANS
jgi:hypothetical protein